MLRRARRSLVSPILAAAAALALAAAAVAPAAAEEGRVKAPAFRAETLGGDPVTLDGLVGRGPILVDFWATWCGPCIKELPYIQRIHDEYAERGVSVLAVSIDSPKSQSKVRPFVKGKGFTFTVVLDPSQDLFRKLQGKGTVPYVVVLDDEGYIRYHHTGYKHGDENELQRVVDELLAESAAKAEAGTGDTAAEDAGAAG